MITPKLRFQGFVKDLEQHEFRDFIKSSKYGPRFDAKDYDINGNVKTIRGTDVSLDATIKYEQVPIANLPQSMIDEHRLQNGDILMITTADCGLSAVFEKQEMPYIASAYAVRICLNEKMDSHWAKYYLQTNHITNEVNKYIRKGTLSNLPLSDISRFIVNVPALKEQTKIAEFLSAVDDKISQLNRQLELLNQYKKGVMQKIFSQEIRFKNDNGEDFGEWDLVTLGEITTDMQSGLSRKLNDSDTGLVVLRSNNIDKNSLDFTDIKYWYKEDPQGANVKNYLLEDGDILVNFINSLSQIGKTAIFYNKLNRDIICTTNILRLKVDKKRALNTFINFIFQTEEYINYIQSITKPAVNQASFTTKEFKLMEINLPTIQEQKKIAGFLTAIDERIDHTTAQLTHTKQWKKGLLQQMFV